MMMWQPSPAHEATVKCERVGNVRCRLGESPLWHVTERCLYWIDVPTGLVHRYEPATSRASVVACGEALGALLQGQDGALLALGCGARAHVIRQGRVVHTVQARPAQPGYRFNDALVDPQGRLWCGVMNDSASVKPQPRWGRVQRRVQRALGGRRQETPDPTLGLYRLTEDARLTQVVSGSRLSNGLGLDAAHTRLYHVDSLAGCVYAYAYRAATGELGRREVFARFQTAEGMPDGLTLDSHDHVWLALWGGSAVVRIDPQGRVVQRINVPARNVTSVAFGGDDLGHLYITTAETKGDAHGGDLFRVRPGVRGRAEFLTPLTHAFASQRTVLITGAAGDLGSKVAAHLGRQPQIQLVLLDRDPRDMPNVQSADLAEPRTTWAQHFRGVDAVVHFAAVPRPDATRSEAQRDNVHALQQVLDTCVEARVRRLVFASTNFVLAGYRHGKEALTPQLQPRPVNAYGDSKLAGERMCQRYAAEHGLSTVCLRFGTVQRNGAAPESMQETWYRQMWLSDRDLCQVVELALQVRDVPFAVLNAMSDNAPSRWDLSDTRRVLGYEPQDGYRPSWQQQVGERTRRAITMARGVARRTRAIVAGKR